MRDRAAVAIGSVVVAWILSVGGTLLTAGEHFAPRTWVDLSGNFVAPVLAAMITFWAIGAWAAARDAAGNRPAGAALVLGIIAVGAFIFLVWTASSFVVGVAAAVLGRDGLDRARAAQDRRYSVAGAGAVLGSLAALGTVVFWIVRAFTEYSPKLPG